MDRFINLLLKPIGPYLIAGGAVLLAAMSAGGAWWATSSVYELRIAKGQVEKLEAVADRMVSNQAFYEDLMAATALNVDNYLKARGAIETQMIDALREVHSHVTPEIDRHYPLPWSLIRVHDSGALGVGYAELASAGYGADDAPASVTASALADRITTNYGACRQAYTWGTALMADDQLVRKMYNDYRAKLAQGPK